LYINKLFANINKALLVNNNLVSITTIN